MFYLIQFPKCLWDPLFPNVRLSWTLDPWEPFLSRDGFSWKDMPRASSPDQVETCLSPARPMPRLWKAESTFTCTATCPAWGQVNGGLGKSSLLSFISPINPSAHEYFPVFSSSREIFSWQVFPLSANLIQWRRLLSGPLCISLHPPPQSNLVTMPRLWCCMHTKIYYSLWWCLVGRAGQGLMQVWNSLSGWDALWFWGGVWTPWQAQSGWLGFSLVYPDSGQEGKGGVGMKAVSKHPKLSLIPYYRDLGWIVLTKPICWWIFKGI